MQPASTLGQMRTCRGWGGAMPGDRRGVMRVCPGSWCGLQNLRRSCGQCAQTKLCVRSHLSPNFDLVTSCYFQSRNHPLQDSCIVASLRATNRTGWGKHLLASPAGRKRSMHCLLSPLCLLHTPCEAAAGPAARRARLGAACRTSSSAQSQLPWRVPASAQGSCQCYPLTCCNEL